MARNRSLFSRTWIPWLFLFGFTLLIFLGDAFHLFETQELGFLDLRFRMRGDRRPHPDIVIVEINDESIQRIGHWPWPRSYHAALLNILSSHKPRAILYDVLFTEASLSPKDDELLAHSMKQTESIIASFFFRSEDPFIAFFPLASFREAVRYLGYVNIYPDQDARVRHILKSIHPREAGGDASYFHTSVMAVLSGLSEEERKEQVRKIPVDRANSFWINFPGRYSLFRRIAFHEVVAPYEGEEGAVDLREFIQGKVVIVGHTATGGGDFRPTPFSPAYPGVGIQAASVHTLLTGDYLRRFGGFVSLLILSAATFLVAFLTWKNPPAVGLLAAFTLALFYLVWNFLLFRLFGWIFPVFPVLTVITGTYLLALFLQFLQVRLEGELLSHELALAARIQESLLLREAPQMEGIDLGFQCLFARTVGGDLYDWAELAEGKLSVCIGDVSGKGVPAALYMARALSEFRSLVRNYNSPSALLGALNQRLYAEGQGIFVTLLYLILDRDSKTISWSNAGHEPPFFYRKIAGKGEWFRGAGGRPLGLFPDGNFPEEKISFKEGDMIVLVSDGVKELRNPKGREFGYEGMAKALDSFPEKSARGMVERLFRAMDEFSRKNPAHDDRTVVCLKIGGGR